MALLFIIQMSVSIGAIAVSHEQQSNLMEAGWSRMSPDLKTKIQTIKDCCGFKNRNLTSGDMGHPKCNKVSLQKKKGLNSAVFYQLSHKLIVGISFNPLSPSINIQILLTCLHTFVEY